jgi:uncharacterized coiled-coil DUF342 family protein
MSDLSDTRREELAERLRRALEEVERLKKERDQVISDLILNREKYESLKTAMQDLAGELDRLRAIAADRALG